MSTLNCRSAAWLSFRNATRMKPSAALPEPLPDPDGSPLPRFAEGEANAADEILQDAYRYSADNVGFALRLSDTMAYDDSHPTVATLLGQNPSMEDRVAMILRLLRAAGLHAYELRGFELAESARNMPLVSLIELWDHGS